MNKKGFTLVEIMLVVAIIALLAAIVIPNLLRIYISAQESAAAVALHTIVTVETQWRASHPSYAALGSLDDETPPYIDSTLAGGTKRGYIFAVTTGANNFFATAEPQINTQAHTFYIDEQGLLCRSNTLGVTAVTEHVAAGSKCPANYTEVQ